MTHLNRTRSVVLVFGLVLLAASVFFFRSTVYAQDASLRQLVGVLNVNYLDVFQDGRMIEYPPEITLTDRDGVVHVLALDTRLTATYGGLERLQGRRVTVEIDVLAPAMYTNALQVHAFVAVEARGTAVVRGNERWLMLLCRAAESAVVYPNPQEHYAGLWANNFPGMDHYWREVSYGQYSVADSQIVGWYDLPQAGSYYWYIDNGVYRLHQGHLAPDCTAVADADVYFPDYAGIVFLTPLPANLGRGFMAYGTNTVIDRDGVTKLYRTVYMPREIGEDEDNYLLLQSQAILPHEMGHTLGLMHSSGPYGETYDSLWDVMGGLRWIGIDTPCRQDATYGCVAPHLIAFHKDLLGWIAPARKVTIGSGTSQMFNLSRLATPRTEDPLLIQIPLNDSGTQFYTVEARRRGTYESSIPNSAVIIHKVDTTRADRKAQVVDSDGDGDPNDAGAAWLPGETFTDAAHNIHVCVESEITGGYQVGIGNGALAPCVFAPSFVNSTYLWSDMTYPEPGENFEMTLEFSNVGAGLASNVVATITLPVEISIIPGTIDTYGGSVINQNPIVFHGGSMVYDDYGQVVFQAQIDPAITEPKSLTSFARVTWDGGYTEKDYTQIANALHVYLPTIRRSQ